MRYDQQKKCRRIIYGAAFAGALVGGGLAQLPGSDNLILVPIELIMVMLLGRVFRRGLRHSYRNAVTVGTVATMLGRGVSEWLVGWIPLLGNAIDAATAALVISVLGWLVARGYEKQELRETNR